jgi:tRNA pseudouridine38-40 synthase
VGVPTIQEAVEQKLERITGAPTAVVGAGRTDAGVHATGQVINFRTEGAIPTERVCMALNSLPPYSIVARGAREVEPEFHARFDATSRSYRYVILRGDPSPFLRRYAWRVTVPLDVAQMREAAGALVGRFDFAAFCAAGAEVRTVWCASLSAPWSRSGAAPDRRARWRRFATAATGERRALRPRRTGSI